MAPIVILALAPDGRGLGVGGIIGGIGEMVSGVLVLEDVLIDLELDDTELVTSIVTTTVLNVLLAKLAPQ